MWIECEWDSYVFHINAMDVSMTMDNDQGFHIRVRDNEDEEIGWYTVVGTSPEYSMEEQHEYRNRAKELLGLKEDPPFRTNFDTLKMDTPN